MLLLITSFLAGILTVFAPCVLILLPVIVGSSLATDDDKEIDRKKPYIIAINSAESIDRRTGEGIENYAIDIARVIEWIANLK